MNNRIEIAKEFANNINSENIEKIILFGSVARMEDTIESDIDILIVSDNKSLIEPKIRKAVVNTIKNYGELISAHVISENNFNNTINHSFLRNVMEDGIIL